MEFIPPPPKRPDEVPHPSSGRLPGGGFKFSGIGLLKERISISGGDTTGVGVPRGTATPTAIATAAAPAKYAKAVAVQHAVTVSHPVL